MAEELNPDEGRALVHQLSGYAHAHQWILATTALSEGSPVPLMGARLVQASAKIDVAASFAVAARNTLSAALVELEQYAAQTT